ncbi:MAG TPA: rod shape-determining protein RodA [Kiritimatiellia bacterium]|nr:rod shape-determining protein RodA [Kiritimatiellia bacterium]
MNLDALQHVLKRMDWWMVLSIIALLLVGTAFIFSASYRSDGTAMADFYQKQIVWAVIGLGLFLVFAFIDYRRLRDAAWWLYALGIILLVLVLLFGKKVYGAYRWLNLFGVQIQPSEFGKLATLVLLARFLGRPGRDVREPKCVVQTLLLMGVPFVLILKEPDLGSASMLLPLAFIMMYAAGVPLKYLGILVLIGVLLMPVGWFGLGDYQKERILVFFDPGRDPLGSGWNKIQSEIAVGSGGFSGKGYLKGTQNVLGFLPRTVAPTDFIYSVIAEEVGFVGSVMLLALYAMLLSTGIRAALAARDKLGRLLAAGVTGLVFCHVFVNIAMTIGLLPITGLPLPLISYGGSFMVSTMMGLGIVQSVYVRRYQQ